MTEKLKSIFGLCSIASALALAAPNTSFAEEAEHFQRFSALPVLGYSEETALEYGAMLLLFFKPSFQGGETTTIDFAALGTTKKQFELLVTPRYYLFHDQIKGLARLTVDNWTSSFYGIGNDPDLDDGWKYDRKTLSIENITQTNLGLPSALKNFLYGITLHAEYSDISFKSYKGELERPELNGEWRTGLGYQLSYDTRDNENWARHGFYAHWNQKFYTDAIGDYSFTTQELDLRGYTYLFWKTSMAVSALWQRTDGDVPFDMLAGPDGTSRFRGVKDHFFRDDQALILQAELRKVLFWRLAGTIFFEGGKSGEYFSDLMREKWHQAPGFGGELALNMAEQLYARGDISWVDYKHIGLTVYIRQAF